VFTGRLAQKPERLLPTWIDEKVDPPFVKRHECGLRIGVPARLARDDDELMVPVEQRKKERRPALGIPHHEHRPG
jgi:hypothetical protein